MYVCYVVKSTIFENKMWYNILFGLNLLILQTTAVNMCSNESTVSTIVTLNLLRGTGFSGCRCSVKLQNPETIVKPRITFQAKKFSGCQYVLVISYDNKISIYSCTLNNYNIVYDINPADEIKINLNGTFAEEKTEFEVKITSNITATRIKLECFAPITSTEKATTTSTSNPQPTTSLSTTSSTTDMKNSRDSSTKQEDAGNDEDNVCGGDNDDGNVTAGIIGGVIGVIIGVVGSIVAFIIIRIMKNRKKKSTSEIYSSPSPQNQPESFYTDLQMS